MASGQVTIIADFKLRNNILALYEQYYWGIAEYDKALTEHIRDHLKPYVIDNTVKRGAFSMDDTFLNDPVFQNIIFPLTFLFESKQQYCELARKETNELLIALNKYQQQ